MMIAECEMRIADLMAARYEEGGRGPDSFDCFGLFAELCRRRGMAIPDHPTPADLCQRQSDIRIEAAEAWHELDAPEPGCAVLMRIGPWVSHIGMMLDGDRFIHASRRTGITVTRLDDLLWRERIAGFYRYRGRDE